MFECDMDLVVFETIFISIVRISGRYFEKKIAKIIFISKIYHLYVKLGNFLIEPLGIIFSGIITVQKLC